MVDVDLIVQRQRMVTHAPVVSDPQQLIDDQRIDVQLDQPSSDGQPVLTCADDENRGIAVAEGARLHPLVKPVLAAEIA